MAKVVKRGVSVVCVVIMLVSMLSVPVSAASDWKFQFTSNFHYSDYATRHGTWRNVYFKFKGTGIQKIVVRPWTNNANAPVQAKISYVNWRPAGQWCDGCIRVRSLNNGDGVVDIFINGDPFWCWSVVIGYP
ncbi:MAG: hypothetical protein IKR84_01440 [Oscillibacter sp.]|nr:hypothetical protein [Oscillibacter sp.]